MPGWDDSGAVDAGWGVQAAPEEASHSVSFQANDHHSGYGGDEEGGGGSGGGGGNAGGDACRICGQDGHFARECPDKPANDGACFNCGEQGHMKGDCPEPPKTRGNCRICDQEGHMARECPEKPAELCRNCNLEGHNANDCENPRFIDKSLILQKSAEEAWEDLKNANNEEDFDAFKIHLVEYMKACPGSKFDEIETAFRANEFNYYLFALDREVEYYECIVGPNGESDAKYTWTLNKSPKPRRSRAIAHRMAQTPEENLERLKFAGEVMNETKSFCYSCKQKGHSKRECEIDQAEDEFERVVLKCGNCSALDHRLRDCPEPRKPDYNPNACKNCGEEGHRAAECPLPRVADENTECRKCGEMGHFSKECPQGGGGGGGGGGGVCYNCGQEGHRSSDCTNERVFKCRNCDEFGHSAKECSKPKDITRVKCNNCGEMGHYSRGCTNEKPAEAEEETYDAYPSAKPTPAVSTPVFDVPTFEAPAWGASAEVVVDDGW